MNTPAYRDHTLTVYLGDCLHILPELPDGSVDSVVTDPPYGLEFMGKEWDGANGFRRSLNTADVGRDNAFGRTSRTSPEYRAGELFQQWCGLWAAECLRILKPGGHMLAFGGTRTWHRLACAVEDASFEIRDSIAWLYGSGFPKSRTALKPAHEPIVVARKPLTGTVAANVLTYGTGALNIDACRIGTDDTLGRAKGGWLKGGYVGGESPQWDSRGTTVEGGRWPANVVLDETQAAALDRMSGDRPTGAVAPYQQSHGGDSSSSFAHGQQGKLRDFAKDADSGGASRFYYVAKADQTERIRLDGTAHPTVKPLALMRWLTRLVTPPGGTILEPFAGSGTTIEAALLEGFHAIAIEQEPDYLPIIVQRINRRRDPVAAVKAVTDDLGLFALLDDKDTP